MLWEDGANANWPPKERGAVSRSRLALATLPNVQPTALAKAVVKRALGLRPGATVSFSSCGEDMVIRHLLGTTAGEGFYLDVGAWHPTQASNTYHFYRLGWNGITVEPQPSYHELHRRVRPRDISLQVSIGDSCRTDVLRIPASGSAMAGFDPLYGHDDVVKIDTKVVTLSALLTEYLPQHLGIDFMSIDVEGAELEVLASNDWSRWRPRVICVESSTANRTAVEGTLIRHGYEIVGWTSILIGQVINLFAVDGRLDWSLTQRWPSHDETGSTFWFSSGFRGRIRPFMRPHLKGSSTVTPPLHTVVATAMHNHR